MVYLGTKMHGLERDAKANSIHKPESNPLHQQQKNHKDYTVLLHTTTVTWNKEYNYHTHPNMSEI